MDQRIKTKLGPAKPGFEWVEKGWGGMDLPTDGDMAVYVTHRGVTEVVPVLDGNGYEAGKFTAASSITGKFYRQEPVKKLKGSSTVEFSDLSGYAVNKSGCLANALGIGQAEAAGKTFRITYEEV